MSPRLSICMLMLLISQVTLMYIPPDSFNEYLDAVESTRNDVPEAVDSTTNSPVSSTQASSTSTASFKLSDLYNNYPWIDDLVARFIEMGTRLVIWIIARFAFKYNARFADFI